jgi:hypothetical protein
MNHGGIFNGPTALGIPSLALRPRAFGDVSTVTLKQGVRYRGRLRVKHSCTMVGIAGGASKVADGLEHPKEGGPGMTNVQVWLDPNKLPADWPADKRAFDAGSGNCPAWVEGDWPHPSVSEPNQGDEDADLVDYWPAQEAQPAVPPTPPPVDPGSGAINIPWWCWNAPGFKSAHGMCWNTTSGVTARNECIQKFIGSMCPWESDPSKKTPTPGGSEQQAGTTQVDSQWMYFAVAGIVAALAYAWWELKPESRGRR